MANTHLQDTMKFIYQAWNQVCVNLSPNCQQSAINYLTQPESPQLIFNNDSQSVPARAIMVVDNPSIMWCIHVSGDCCISVRSVIESFVGT